MEDLLIIQKIEDMMRYGYQAGGSEPMKRHGFLIIGIACLFGVLFCLAAIAKAETTVGFEAIGSGAGYDTGYGVTVSHTTGRYADIFAAHVSGNIANRKKHNASEGYTYGASGQVRAYYQDVYFGVGYGVAGYRSEFDSGAVWEKSMWQPHVSVGYDTDLFDLWTTYHFEENDTPNQVSSFSGGGKLKVWRGMFISAEAQMLRFLQAGERERDTIFTVGIGWEF
jgi:hypothetical protein